MTIQLPEDLERSVQDVVRDGRFSSEGELVAAALRAFLDQAPRAASPGRDPVMGSIGAMADDAELLEQVTQAIMLDRETRVFRLSPHE